MTPPLLASTSAAFSHTSPSVSASYLDKARKLALPSRDEMLRRAPSVYKFWQENEIILQKAWMEWSEEINLPQLNDSVLDPKLREAIDAAWNDSSKEHLVRDLWEEVAPGVFKCQFIDPLKINLIRKYLDEAAVANIPTRPPHGIVLNRKGFMIDPRSVGHLAIPQFQEFYRNILIDKYMRPLGRLFFPEYVNADDDSESFSFSIQYQAGKDQSIRQHSDASAVTLNVNLNLPSGEEDFTGSSLYFVDPVTGKKNLVNFAPGVAVIHRGATQHAALPITSGERSNLVMWLFGKDRYSSYEPYSIEDQLTSAQRWTKPEHTPDYSLLAPHERWSPF